MSTAIDQEATPTVFVVDDDEAVLDSVGFLLQRLNVKFECFSSAEDFLERWGGPRPGCLILDVRMSGMSGIELQRELNLQHHYLPIVLVTGHATVSLSVQAMQRGAIDILEKPYTPDTLRHVVNKGLACAAEWWTNRQQKIEFEAKRASLSPREGQVYGLLLKGMENKQIATALAISPSTVEKHRLAVVRKMGIDNITQLIAQKFDATGSLQDAPAESDETEPS